MRVVRLTIGMLALAGVTAQADVSVTGDTSVRYEQYRVSGDRAHTPYPHQGSQLYQDLNLRITGSPEAGRYWEFNTSALLNRSDYRHEERGLVPEWVHMRYEDGTVALPYRLDVGDQQSRFTPLTLNQRLQAARVELQPAGQGPLGGRHSVVWMSGRDSTDWNNPDPAVAPRYYDTRYHGVSWLMDGVGPGRYSVNVLQQDPGDLAHDRDTGLITSLAGEWGFSLARQALTAEAEWAQLDERGLEEAVESDRGLRAQLAGEVRDAPLDYRLRYRRFGDGFRPLGSDITPDSRLLGASAGLGMPLGVRLSGSVERQTTAVTQQRLELDDYGLVMLAPETFGVAAWMDHEWGVRVRERENRTGGIRDRATEARWTVNVASRERSETRMSMRWLGVEDDSPLDRDRREHRFALSHAERFSLGAVDLTAVPGVDYRHRSGYWPMTLVHPTFRLDAGVQAHRMGLELGYRALERRDALMDVDEYSLRLDYRYRRNSHVIGLEYDQQLREPEEGDATEAWRAGLFWRYEFRSLDGLSMALP